MFIIGNRAVIMSLNALAHCSLCVGSSVEPVWNQCGTSAISILLPFGNYSMLHFACASFGSGQIVFIHFWSATDWLRRMPAQRPQTQGRLQYGCVCVCKVSAAQVSVEQGVQGEGGSKREGEREYHGELKFSSARLLEICSQVVDRVACFQSPSAAVSFIPFFASYLPCWL